MIRAKYLVGAAFAALLVGLSVPAQAQVSSFIEATCGMNCQDQTGEEANARQNWQALSAMGTTSWIGSTMGSSTVDASSLLAASRVAGASELDRWLTTGSASDTGVAQQMSYALQNVHNIDVTDITGTLGKSGAASSNMPLSSGSSSSSSSSSSLTNSLEQTLTNALAGNNSFMGPGGGGGSGYCDDGVAQATTAAAQKYVNNMQTIATSGDLGFSQLGGSAISSGQRSASGYTGSSCLDSLMQGTRDMLFKPPQLSQLLGSLMSMFGGSGGSQNGCAAASSIMTQVAGSLPNSIFQTGGMGGFFPYIGGMGAEGSGAGNNLSFASGFNLMQSVGGTNGSRAASISNLLR